MLVLLSQVTQEKAVSQQTESQWISDAKAGDRAAFEQLYRGHVGRVYALCLRMVGGQVSVAEELTQDAFVRAWQKLARFESRARFSTWLHRLTVNLVLDDRRSQAKRLKQELHSDGHQERAADPLRRRPGICMDLEQLLARLPEQARRVLVLHDIEGYKHREIGEQMGIAEGSSKAHLYRARQLLKEWMA